jgi:hypothetical protein
LMCHIEEEALPVAMLPPLQDNGNFNVIWEWSMSNG